jgi:DnaJ like chaperone protein
MRWYGKAIGAVLGFAIGRNPLSAFIGFLIGHYFDLQAARGAANSDPRAVPDAFFRATFQVMGHVAKADGRVSEEEIRAARAVMGNFNLREPEVRLAIELFTQGKASDFPMADTVRQLGRVLGNRVDMRRMFVQIQLQAALWSNAATGVLHPAARAALKRVCDSLGVSEFELAQLEALLRMQRAGQSAGAGSSTYGRSSGAYQTGPRPQRETVQDAYSVLGLQPTASDSEVTKAYRRLMSQNHPDKMAANGLPESMKAVAEEKTRQIRAAYEAIRDSRGMK